MDRFVDKSGDELCGNNPLPEPPAADPSPTMIFPVSSENNDLTVTCYHCRVTGLRSEFIGQECPEKCGWRFLAAWNDEEIAANWPPGEPESGEHDAHIETWRTALWVAQTDYAHRRTLKNARKNKRLR